MGSIRAQGILPGKRDKVHLSANAETARTVGARHGKPVVLGLLLEDLLKAGQQFWVADNGVWLTDRVAPEFIDWASMDYPDQDG